MMQTRRYDLDWLRAILFGILVPYHALIGFVSYGADVYGYRNQDIGGDTPEFIIFILHTWRLPALFLISGVGTYFLMRRRGVAAFVGNRIIRILFPLIIGVVFWSSIIAYHQSTITHIVPAFPQFWWERLSKLDPNRTGHLWFLINLFFYSILAVPLFRVLLQSPSSKIARALPIFTGFIILFAALWIKPQGAVFGEYLTWKTVIYAMYYIPGFWLMTTSFPVWALAARFRYVSLIGGIITVAILGLYLISMYSDTDDMNRMINGYWINQNWPRFSLINSSYSTLYALTTLLWCAAIFGFGHHHLNGPHRFLPKLNRAVYPFYIFHMVVLLVVLFYLRFTPWPWVLEFFILTITTYLGTAILYLIFDKTPFLGPLVGLSRRKSTPP
jgi:glucan biosynthesis protein C